MQISKSQARNRINIFSNIFIPVVVAGSIFFLVKIILCPFTTKFDIPVAIYNQIKTAKPNELTILRISKYKKGMLIFGKAKKNKNIASFMTAISKKGIGIPSLQSVTKSNNVSSFILMVRNKN